MTIRNSRGIITVDFLFSIVVCFGLSMILFAFSFTLVMVEATQYIAYASARAQAAGGADPDLQELAGRSKFTQLLNTPPFSKLYRNGWFLITKTGEELDIRSGYEENSFYEDYSTSSKAEGEALPFTGVRIPFQAPVLAMKIPFIGSTADPDAKNGFSTIVTGFLIREPSVLECQNFMKNRYAAIQKLDGRFSKTQNTNGTTAYAPIEDNGC